jgi:hypothetical protein
MNTLKVKQQEALQAMLQGKNVFLSGKAGTGKSYVVQKFCEKMSARNLIITAPTGIAAENIGGVTIHNAFQIPIGPLFPTAETVKVSEAIKKADTIIIDEISMTRGDVFQYIATVISEVDRMRMFENRNSIQLIVVGDFFQLAPVLTKEDKELFLNTDFYSSESIEGGFFAFQSPAWKYFDFVNVVLDEVVRQSDPLMVMNLNRIREGDEKGISFFNQQAKKKRNKKAIFLSAIRKKVAKVNEVELGKLAGREFVFESEDYGKTQGSARILESTLKLKLGCRVIFLINDLGGDYRNGTMGTLLAISKNDELEDVLVIQTDDGEEVTVECYTQEIGNYTVRDVPVDVKTCHCISCEQCKDYLGERCGKGRKLTQGTTKDVIGYIKQFPIRLAYAITIHKSQGQTYEQVNLDPYCFADGQLYVALSRVKSVDGLYLPEQLIDVKSLKTSEVVKEFYKKIEK